MGLSTQSHSQRRVLASDLSVAYDAPTWHENLRRPAGELRRPLDVFIEERVLRPCAFGTGDRARRRSGRPKRCRRA